MPRLERITEPQPLTALNLFSPGTLVWPVRRLARTADGAWELWVEAEATLPPSAERLVRGFVYQRSLNAHHDWEARDGVPFYAAPLPAWLEKQIGRLLREGEASLPAAEF